MSEHPESISAHDLDTCLRVLQHISDTRTQFPREHRLSGLIAKLYRESRRNDKQAEKRAEREGDRARQATTVMVQIQRDAHPSISPATPRFCTGKALPARNLLHLQTGIY